MVYRYRSWALLWATAAAVVYKGEAERVQLAFDESHQLTLEGDFSNENLVELERNINDWCTYNMSIGYLTTGCIEGAVDYTRSFAQDRVQPCHSAAVQACSQRAVFSRPADYSISADNGNDASDIYFGASRLDSGALSKRRLRSLGDRYAMSQTSLCTFDAIMRCDIGATLIVDLNCDDYGVHLSSIADGYKYTCVSTMSELHAAHLDPLLARSREVIHEDVFSPSLFTNIRRKSRLWTEVDTVVVVARNVLEFLPYEKSLDFLERLKHSGASHFVGSNSAGSISHNPVELNRASGYTPLNFHKYPFHLSDTRKKWREWLISLTSVTQVWDIAADIPSGYPYYYDELICSNEASNISKEEYGSNCRSINVRSLADWALFVHRAEGSVHSQGGQDGALQYIFQHIGVTSRSFVEFGFNGLTYESDTGANTNFLYQQGWRGLLLDGENNNPALNLHATWVDPNTIVSVFDKHKVTEELDYLSIDIDSTELWTFRAIVSSGKYRPRVVSVEYNSNYPLESTLCNTGGDYRWYSDKIWGSALLPLKMVGDEFGYTLVDVVSYLDAIFVRTDLLNGSRVPDFETWRPFTRLPHHEPGRRSQKDIRNYVADYAEWSSNGHDIDSAKGDVVLKQIERLSIEM